MKHIKEYPSQQILNEIYRYENGKLIRKISFTSNTFVGEEVGFKSTNGYLECKIKKQKYAVHRIIWIMHYGDIPLDMVVNHKNNIKNDNRIENLEIITNRKNVALSRNPKSGYTGVAQVKDRWVAMINPKKSKRSVFIGSFATKEEAAKAYDKKSIEIDGKNAHTNFPIDTYDSKC